MDKFEYYIKDIFNKQNAIAKNDTWSMIYIDFIFKGIILEI